MIAPTLTATERALILAAKKMVRIEYPCGSVCATDGHHALFAAGGAEPFDALWRQAEQLRAEATA